jgi:hypothetical protein
VSILLISLHPHILLAQPVPSALTIEPFPKDAFVETYDQPIFQSSSRAKPANGGPSTGAGIVWYDSYGRVRFDRSQPDTGLFPPDIGYHYLQVTLNGGTRVIPANELSDISLAAGFTAPGTGDDKLGCVLGLGYSGDKPFEDANGLYGIGHVNFQHALDRQNSLVLSLDYNGNSEFLPDIPLPGIGLAHRENKFDYLIGFPESTARLSITDNLELRGRYSVPYSANVDLEYKLTNNFSLYGQAAHFFHGFELAHQPQTDRLFEEMTRVEVGVRVIWGSLIDISVGGGYAMNQDFYRGWDVRRLDRIASVSDEPYLGFIVRGRF